MKGINATWDERAARARAYAEGRPRLPERCIVPHGCMHPPACARAGECTKGADLVKRDRETLKRLNDSAEAHPEPVCDSVQVEAPRKHGVIQADKPYGCHNRAEFLDAIPMQSGWTEDGRRNMVPVPNRMRRDCSYTHTALGQADPRCTGCERRTTEPKGC